MPSLAFMGALLAAAIGNVAGPVAAGMISEAFGAEMMFYAVAVLPALTALLLRERHGRERPA